MRGAIIGGASIPADGLPEPAGVVREPVVIGLPAGYRYGVSRYADIILRDAFPQRFQNLIDVLSGFQIELQELLTGGGARSTMTARFDRTLGDHGWGKRTVTIAKQIDGRLISAARGHEIDMFAAGPDPGGYPGVAVEMEWNNKDPFFDRDLVNFMALHREGALAVGIIVTRGPRLQAIAGPVIKTGPASPHLKYGQSSTHWDKVIPRINLGGGGECPLLVVGIEPERVNDFVRVEAAHRERRHLWQVESVVRSKSLNS